MGIPAYLFSQLQAVINARAGLIDANTLHQYTATLHIAHYT